MSALRLFLPLFAGSLLWGNTITATYEISFSVFGTIGMAEVSMARDATRYRVHVDAYLVGMAASIGGNRRETHDSYGSVTPSGFLPERYEKHRSSDTRDDTTLYRFDHEAHRVLKIRDKTHISTHAIFDPRSMSIVDVPETVREHSESELPYYAPDDLLSLFFNIRHLLDAIPKGGESIRHSVGAANAEGIVRITNPDGAKRREIAELMPENEDRLVTVVVDQDIFESDKGELYLNLDSDYLVIEAMLKDVLLFGDIRAKRVELRKIP